MRKKAKTKKKTRASKVSPNLQLARLILEDLDDVKLGHAVNYLRSLRGPKK